MRILGISDHIISGAAVLEDGVVTAAVNEERLVRKKMVMGFPRKSIQTVLELAKIRPDQIDYVAVASKRGHFLDDMLTLMRAHSSVNRGFVKELFMSVGLRPEFFKG